MTPTDYSNPDVDALMRQIRIDIAGRKERTGASAFARSATSRPGTDRRRSVGGEPPTLTRLPVFAPPLAQKAEYTLADFLNYHDEDFLHNAYRAILRREPNDDGAKRFLTRLRTGDLSKLEILGRMRYSREGRAAAVRVRRLMAPFAIRTLRRAPVLGYVLGIGQYILRLPNMVRCHERLEAVVFQHYFALRRDVNGVEEEVETALLRQQDLTVASIGSVEEGIAAIETAAISSRNSIAAQLEVLSADVGGKVDRHELDVVEKELRKLGELRHALSALEKEFHQESERQSAKLLNDLNLLEVRVRAETDAQIANVRAAATDAHAELRALTAVVTALEQWAAKQPSNEQLRETISVAAAAQSAAAAVADGLIALREDAGRIAAAAQSTAAVAVDGITALRADAGRIAAEVAAARADTVRIEAGLGEQLNARLTAVNRSLLESRQAVVEQERRLGILLEGAGDRSAIAADPARSPSEQSELQHLYDPFYVSFEETFRGTSEDIKQRVAVYLPYLQAAQAGTREAPVLDIGCGRGEWLELLKENRLEASGVDMNRVNVAQCRERGLAVVEADALTFLRGLKTGSVGALTAIHIIEHLPFRQLMHIFEEALRVLKPGGLAIFETPNPENLIVGSCNFWYDPTHHHPLPPEPMRFILDNRGFTRVEILRLHPVVNGATTASGADEFSTAIAARFNGPQDYALIGYRD